MGQNYFIAKCAMNSNNMAMKVTACSYKEKVQSSWLRWTVTGKKVTAILVDINTLLEGTSI